MLCVLIFEICVNFYVGLFNYVIVVFWILPCGELFYAFMLRCLVAYIHNSLATSRVVIWVPVSANLETNSIMVWPYEKFNSLRCPISSPDTCIWILGTDLGLSHVITMNLIHHMVIDLCILHNYIHPCDHFTNHPISWLYVHTAYRLSRTLIVPYTKKQINAQSYEITSS